jgi:hypothetical protein
MCISRLHIAVKSLSVTLLAVARGDEEAFRVA